MRRKTAFCRCAAEPWHPAQPRLEAILRRSMREDQLSSRVDDWIAKLFSPEHIDSTVDASASAANEGSPEEGAEARFRRRIVAAEGTMVRLNRAWEAGGDPVELTSQYNAAVAEKRAAEAGMAAIERPRVAEVSMTPAPRVNVCVSEEEHTP